LTPALPAGLTFTASTRVLAGTPTATKASTTYTYKASDGTLSATLTFTIQVSAPAASNNAPTFTEGTTATRSIAENTAADTAIGTAVGATDDDNDTLTYTLGGTNASAFKIVSTSGQLQTKDALDYEAKSSYSVTVSVSDSNGGSDSIAVTISVTNVEEKPKFASSTYTLEVAENTAADTNIGEAFEDLVSNTGDVTKAALTFTMHRADRVSFTIDSDTGQLKTKDPLDYEIKTSYTVAIRANEDSSDPQGDFGVTIVTINVTDVENDRAAAAPSVPVKTALLPNFPNPFNPETWIPYQLSEPADVSLTIYNMRGVVVRKLKLGLQPAGVYQSRSRAIHWDGRNDIGEKVASGVYLYTLRAGDYTATRKMLIRK
jgi:hypothetical protein